MHQVNVIASMEQKYRDELDLYSLLHCLCKEQQQAARRGLTAEVLRLTKAKEELMKRIQGLESEIESLRASLDLGCSDSRPDQGADSSVQNPPRNVLELNPSQHGRMRRTARFHNPPATGSR